MPFVVSTDDWGALDSSLLTGAALTDDYALSWSSGAVGFVAKSLSVTSYILTTNIGGSQIDAGSFTNGTSIQLKDDGVLYLMNNTTGQSDLSAGISVPGATAVGDVFNIGGTLFTHILRPEGSDGASAWLVNLTTGTVSPTPLFIQSGVTPHALATYMAVGGTSLEDVRFLFGKNDSSHMLERTTTSVTRYFDSDIVEYWPTVLLEDLVVDVANGKLYVLLFNNNSGYAFRGNFNPAVAAPIVPIELDPDWFTMSSSFITGLALTDNSALSWSSDGSVGFAGKTSHIVGGLTTNIGGQIDAGSYTDGTSIQLKESGVLYLMNNTTGLSDLSTGISVPSATAVGDVFNIGGTLFTHVLRPEGTDAASAWLVNLTTGWVSPTPLFTQTGVRPQALATYMAIGGTSLEDVRFVFGKNDSPHMVERTATDVIRHLDAFQMTESWPTSLLDDLVVDVPGNMLYFAFNQGSSITFRGYFTPAASQPRPPYDPQPRAEATGGNTLTFSFETRAGLPYTIQRSSDLVTWTDVETILGTGTRHTHEHPLTGQAVFFRVAYLP
ncbi:MAG: hypothetical protein KBC32_11125 [Candidatus Didemnitutus sp.]|nr:hypothetical protein [Candidatus Didemnitutus sp.]